MSGEVASEPDPERMRALKDFQLPNGYKLRRALGIFVNYFKWVDEFIEKIWPLATGKSFPLTGEALNSFEY